MEHNLHQGCLRAVGNNRGTALDESLQLCTDVATAPSADATNGELAPVVTAGQQSRKLIHERDLGIGERLPISSPDCAQESVVRTGAATAVFLRVAQVTTELAC